MDSITYNGLCYTKGEGKHYYSAPRGSGGESFLHRQIWKDNNGPIPDGFVVHHIDHNKENNDPGNLQAMSRKDHAAEHRQDERWNSPDWQAHLASIRGKAAEWHGSPEGLEWHRQHGAASWEGREPCASRPCKVCGEQFSPMFERGETCSNRCHQTQRRADGTDNEERLCTECGASYVTNKYRKSQTCSRSCGGKAGARKRLAKR